MSRKTVIAAGSVALAAGAILFASDLLPETVRLPFSSERGPARSSPEESRKAVASTPLVPASRELPVVAEAPPAPSYEVRPPEHPRPVLPEVTQPRETGPVLRGTSWVTQLALLPGLRERLAYVDDLGRKLEPADAASIFEGLLDADLPGTAYENEQLRLSMIAWLGRLPGARSDAVLASRIEKDRPRPQRLLALELLAGRPNVARDRIADVARKDADSVVQAKAKWVLAQGS